MEIEQKSAEKFGYSRTILTFATISAIHNKDYSVVKTFKSPSSYNTGAFFFCISFFACNAEMMFQ